MKKNRNFSKIALLFLMTFVNVLFHVSLVYPCICFTKEPTCSAYWKADAVFVGTVIDIKPESEGLTNNVNVFFDVEKTFRGLEGGKFILSEDKGFSCSFGFKKDEKYLVYAYAYKDGKTFGTGHCTRTSLYDEKLPDFDFFNALKDSKQEFNIWGTVFRNGYLDLPFAGLKVDAFKGQQKFNGISDKEGNIKVAVNTKGNYTVRVWLPKNGYAGGSVIQLEKISRTGKVGKREFIEYEVEVKPNQCGWFDVPLSIS